MIHFIDYSRAQIANLLLEHDTSEVRAEISCEFMQQVCTELSVARVPVIQGILPGQVGQQFLEHFHQAASRVATRFVAKRPGVEWLWYLRRAPQLFTLNNLRGTRMYCQAIAEQLCAGSPAKGVILDDHRFSLEVADILDLLYLRHAVGEIYEVHSAIRWAGKNANIRFSGFAVPVALPSSASKDALRLYDKRRDDAPTDPLARAGLTSLATLGCTQAGHFHIPVVHQLEQVGVSRIPGNHRLAGKAIDAGYGIASADLSGFEPLFDQTIPLSDGISRQFASAAIGLISLMHPSLVGSFNFMATGVPLANILALGYELTSMDEFRARCAWAVNGAEALGCPGWLVTRAGTADDVVETLGISTLSIHPPRLPLAIWPAQTGKVLLNWASMTKLFGDAIERIGAGGAQANRWAAIFEDQIQRWINRSDWHPTPDLAAMQRQTLRRGGQDLTDLDAVGTHNGQLLIVSCKSRALTDAYERGEYNEVRNVRSQAEQALTDLVSVVADLRDNPVGDNFDFSGYQEIVGVVVFPFLPYVSPNWLSAEAIPGLPSIASTVEFQQFLRVA